MSARCQVLLAEDDPAIRTLIGSALRRRHIDVAAAENGAEALELLQNDDWLVLILDMMMPAVPGWEVVRWMAANPERKPRTVIVVSATERGLLRDLDPAVVNAVIFKPFDVLQLAAYVKASCALPHRDRRRSRVVSQTDH